MDCQLGRITVHCEAFGEGRPLFLLPGWPDSWEVVANYLEPLFMERTGWKRLYVDLPGRGATAGEDWIESNDDVLDVVLEVIDRLAPNGRFVLGGQSAGAYLARGVLARRVDRVDGLLQVVPVIRVDEPAEALPPHVVLASDAALVGRVEAEFGRDVANGFAARVVLQTAPVYERLRALLPAMENHDAEFLARLAPREELSFDVDMLATPFLGPALFILGRQDAVVGYASALSLTNTYPRATMAVVDGAGHAMPWEQPQVFGLLVSDWLDRVDRQTM